MNMEDEIDDEPREAWASKEVAQCQECQVSSSQLDLEMEASFGNQAKEARIREELTGIMPGLVTKLMVVGKYHMFTLV